MALTLLSRCMSLAACRVGIGTFRSCRSGKLNMLFRSTIRLERGMHFEAKLLFHVAEANLHTAAAAALQYESLSKASAVWHLGLQQGSPHLFSAHLTPTGNHRDEQLFAWASLRPLLVQNLKTPTLTPIQTRIQGPYDWVLEQI